MPRKRQRWTRPRKRPKSKQCMQDMAVKLSVSDELAVLPDSDDWVEGIFLMADQIFPRDLIIIVTDYARLPGQYP